MNHKKSMSVLTLGKVAHTVGTIQTSETAASRDTTTIPSGTIKAALRRTSTPKQEAFGSQNNNSQETRPELTQ